jgi:hypothetical protein
MISYRAQTLLDFFLHLFGLYLLVSGRGTTGNRQDAPASVDTIQPRWVLLGGLWAVAFRRCCDRNVWSLRSSKLRRILVRQCLSGYWILRNPSGDKRRSTTSFTFGSLAGAVGYRLWYGVLNPPLDDTADL